MISFTKYRLGQKPGETFTVTSTNAAQTFSSAQRTRYNSHATGCLISVENNPIKFTLGGSVPVMSGLGHTLQTTYSVLLLESPSLVHDFSFCSATDGAHGVLQVTMLFEPGVDLS